MLHRAMKSGFSPTSAYTHFSRRHPFQGTHRETDDSLHWCSDSPERRRHVLSSFSIRSCSVSPVPKLLAALPLRFECGEILAMASAVASTVVAPVSVTVASSSVAASRESSSVKAFSGLKSATLFTSKSQQLSSVQNGSRVQCMQVWNPIGQPKFETFSYLPPLSDDQIARQVDYMIQQNLIPCIEFDTVGAVSRTNFSGSGSSGYYDGRYWTMWKLPMFGCTDSSQVLREIQECKTSYPSCWVRVLGFDSKKQVQICGFLVARPN
uniref:Ribulose bisphosphate carboxylase small subunit, chloroplastic n=1 Tax=Physcomitrium patens TaxID=3218 RepID=A0A2K1JM50_PHYPA|nr:hypothetical protein PHYPA_017453 [Physcomitrium patens]